MQRLEDEKRETHLSDYKVPTFLINETNLTFELDDTNTTVTSQLKIKRNSKSEESPSDIELNGENLKFKSVSLDGKKLESDQYILTDKSLTILNVPNEFKLDIENEINPEANIKLSGLYKCKGNFITHCEAEGFRRITYYLDRPDVMSVFTTTIIGDKSKYPALISNGNLVSEIKLENGKTAITWHDPFKKPSYLYALVAGDFELLKDHHVTTSGKNVELTIYAEKGYGDRLQHAMQELKNSMSWDEQNYGRECDLDNYKIVAVTDFNAGAMENKGLNIFNAKYLLASPSSATDVDYQDVGSVVSHEYFHNWTGNRITVRNWFQLSLKEGLTTFREQSYSENASSVVARIDDVNFLRNAQFTEDAGPLAHPVQPQSYIEISNFYTWTVYKKGAEIYRMLQTALGKEVFRKGMDYYFETYDGQAVTIEHFIKSMEVASNKDLSQFLLWFKQAGTPVLDVTDEYNAELQTYTLKIKQSCLPTPGQTEKKPLPIPVKMGLLDQEGQAITLKLDGQDESTDKVLLITESEVEYHFKDVKSKPVPSLLRHFSAPVRVNYNYSDADLRLLSVHDEDLFNRWSACDRYVMNNILRLIDDYQHGETLKLSDDFIDMFKSLLTSGTNDLTMPAMMLTLPDVDFIAKQMKTIDVDAICKVRQFVEKQLAEKLFSAFLDIYLKCQIQQSHDQQFKLENAGRRALQNRCLQYILSVDGYNEMAIAQFNRTLDSNMTDVMGALRALNHNDCEERTTALNAFHEKWKNDPIVLTKWYMLQAGSTLPSTLELVKSLFSSSEFDTKNPTMVRSLFRPFIKNIGCFHQSSGEGYQFLTEAILYLDKKNPSLSAEFAENYSDWKNYTSPNKELMKLQLQKILEQSDLSSNLYEIALKGLGEIPELKKENNVVELKQPETIVNNAKLGMFGASPLDKYEEHDQDYNYIKNCIIQYIFNNESPQNTFKQVSNYVEKLTHEQRQELIDNVKKTMSIKTEKVKFDDMRNKALKDIDKTHENKDLLKAGVVGAIGGGMLSALVMNPMVGMGLGLFSGAAGKYAEGQYQKYNENNMWNLRERRAKLIFSTIVNQPESGFKVKIC